MVVTGLHAGAPVVPYVMIEGVHEINAEFETAVALIIGANHVFNPYARTNKDSPICGMPISNGQIGAAGQVFVLVSSR